MAADALFDQAASTLIDRGIDGGIDCAIVLGTGLGRIVEDMVEPISVPFEEIPGFPKGSVSGHAKRLSYGVLHGKRVLVFEGRAHFYETGDPAIMRVPLGMLAAFGSPPLILTNAAGSLKPDLRPGGLALITDHINFNGPNPLIGDAGDGRFVPMVDAYDPHLRTRLKKAAAASGANLGEGVYMWFSGPSFETPAEIKMAKTLGADLVGMSTVPEVILARRYGLRVAGISIVTNMGAGILGGAPSHGETRDVAATATTALRRVLRAFLGEL
ncbi:Purine nucleoside phosphorylase [Bosea sp. 62]|uniref:purine-nucleoside phosphorylase n=1 Tax=unclassified Bosea (in: a-proteobacteria) TaxID=2653178 RepID=UPI001259FE93|nr:MULTISPECIES: purine-nucleoside phosphorylase [unclassified Bosea (in: a-proteobacteria)]CAD5284897.1 Purine nucleoside phosphorylase [Bosea sp. 21B]CAD5287634.1 Purine nucleoside phosphorylase [Bosea sp. 46]CAD5301596.1 Purine nucleoside phosphorylase [Bosea sp. 7B]VVT51267.1 Purine nucleoside phosphorylase [Bosea sp. EC-HK365B]VXB11278.1 Purine nucleoside phosphorylase [Bosea sp. 62]